MEAQGVDCLRGDYRRGAGAVSLQAAEISKTPRDKIVCGVWCILTAMLAAVWTVLLGLAIYSLLNLAIAAEPSAPATKVRVPEVSARYRLAVERASARYFAIDASPARLAAQLHQESGWRADARSTYALGLAQFTPTTAGWIANVCPELGAFDPWDPMQAITAAACYDALLWRAQLPMRATTPKLLQQQQPLPSCSRWMYTLRAYNGGDGWLRRERRETRKAGADPDDWRATEKHRLRAVWAHKQNTDYPRRILLRLEPAYIAAGWAGTPVCP